jgi:O-antigen/teichoic acid export membrane protein
VAGFGLAQLIRLGSNLLLTRLLFPEAFGLAALVAIFVQGLELLSDVGLQQSVIQNPRGDERRFLDTAWTLQIVRGFLLFTVAGLLAWPIARLYGEPQLTGLLPVGGITVLLLGFQSTAVFTLRRRMTIGWLVLLELGVVAGGVVAAAFRTAVTHALPVGYRNRFAWDPQVVREIVGFGKWIFGSSAVFFLGRQGDRLMLGSFLGVGPLGVYSIAVMLSEIVGMVIDRINAGVLYPMFSEVGRQGLPELGRIYYRTRLRLDALALPAVGALVALGEPVVHLLWDERYHDAGWMLQILCVRVAMSCVMTPWETALTAIGYPRYGFARSAVKTAWILLFVPLGNAWAGVEGIVWATALSEIPALFVLIPGFVSRGLLRPVRELLAPLLFGAGVVLGSALLWVARMLGVL